MPAPSTPTVPTLEQWSDETTTANPVDLARVPLLLSSALLKNKPLNPGFVELADWHAFAQYAQRRGLAGLILQGINRHGLSISKEIRVALSASATRVAAENLHMLHETERIVRAFDDRGVPVMLLKGAALQLGVYPTTDLRPMSDIDLLVHEHDAGQALHILDELGCRRGFSLLRDDFFPKFHYEVEVIVPSVRPVRIDLHARPFRPLRFSRIIRDDAFWTGALHAPIGTTTALIPRPETNFIHLAAHAAFHGFSRLIWLYDIHRFVETSGAQMDWNLVAANCHEWRLTLPVRQAVKRVSDTLETFIPDYFFQKLLKQKVGLTDRWTLRQAPRDAASPISHVICNFFCTPGWRHRLSYLLALLTPDRAHLGEVYHGRHFGWPIVAHGCRMARAIGRVLSTAAKALLPLPAR